MKIVDLDIIPFRTVVDRFQHGVLHAQAPIIQTLTRIVTDDGAAGYCLGGQGHGDQDGLTPAARTQLLGRMKPLLVGHNPFDREKFWQWMWAAKMPEHLIGVVDMAL